MQQHHHQRSISKKPASEQEKLAAVAYFVGNLRFAGNLQITPEEQELHKFGVSALGLGETSWLDIQKRTEAEYKSMLELFGNLVPDDIDVGELLGEANRQLAETAARSEDRVLDVEAQRAALAKEQEHLQNALRDYRERAALDPLTNTLNRGAIADVARAAIKRNRDEDVPLGSLFIDIDDFKRLNDTYGHDVGDRVLKSAAALLEQVIKDAGTVGRYGGEEFVVVLPAHSANSTREIAQCVVQEFHRLDTTGLGCPGPITCSVGALWVQRLPFTSAEELFAAADHLMYKAKRSGKNRVCFESSISTSQKPSLNSVAPVGAGKSPTPESQIQSATKAPGIGEMLALAAQLNASGPESFSGIRKQERKKLVVQCTLHYFTGSGFELGVEAVVTRNLSTGGAGLLVRRPMIRGEPVEIVLTRKASSFFLAGLVSYCRHIDQTLHDVGVQFVSQSVTPILVDDGAGRVSKHEWVNRAYAEKVSGKLQEQVVS